MRLAIQLCVIALGTGALLFVPYFLKKWSKISRFAEALQLQYKNRVTSRHETQVLMNAKAEESRLASLVAAYFCGGLGIILVSLATIIWPTLIDW